MSLSADGIIICIENRKDSTKKLLELINEFSKVAGYKINIYRNLLAFLYTNNKLTEKEIVKPIPFPIVSKRVKYLGINLNKEINDLYTKNYKTLIEEIEEDTNKLQDIPCSWTGIINLVKMSKAIYRFNTIPIKLLMAYLTELK